MNEENNESHHVEQKEVLFENKINNDESIENSLTTMNEENNKSHHVEQKEVLFEKKIKNDESIENSLTTIHKENNGQQKENVFKTLLDPGFLIFFVLNSCLRR
jgi:hypothetical protein